jgi:hypothetical protein
MPSSNPLLECANVDAEMFSIRNSGLTAEEKSDALVSLVGRWEAKLQRVVALGGSVPEQLAVGAALDYLRETLSSEG